MHMHIHSQNRRIVFFKIEKKNVNKEKFKQIPSELKLKFRKRAREVAQIIIREN